MIRVGQFNALQVTRIEDFGVFFDALDYGSVMLPRRFVSGELSIGQMLEVFLYFDSDSQLVATTERPIAQVGEWGLMRVEGISSIGAFVNWGIDSKDLLIPFSEQRSRYTVGQELLVYVYSDKASGRIVGTTKFNKFLDNEPASYAKNEQVDLLIAERSELGYKAIINGRHWGMIFPSDVFGKLFIGKRLKGYIKQVRDDGKIDLALQKIGVEKLDELSEKIVDLLIKKEGYLPLNDRATPEAIFAVFRTSKGTFKKSIGGLYKQGIISLEAEGIRLIKS